MNEIGVPIIIVCCYLIGELYKKKFKKKTYKFIPIILPIIGGILGILIYYTNKEMIYNVNNIWDALLIGIISGTSSTGTNQIIKKIFNRGEK